MIIIFSFILWCLILVVLGFVIYFSTKEDKSYEGLKNLNPFLTLFLTILFVSLLFWFQISQIVLSSTWEYENVKLTEGFQQLIKVINVNIITTLILSIIYGFQKLNICLNKWVNNRTRLVGMLLITSICFLVCWLALYHLQSFIQMGFIHLFI